MRPLFILLFSLVLFSAQSIAQQSYTWEDYGISFTLADDFKETVSTGEEFSATGDGMDLTIIPFTDETIDDTDITGYTMSIAASLKLGRIDDISTINFNGFKGGYAEGELDGAKIFLMGVIDPNSDTNFFVIITFLDGDANAVEEAVNICKSIKKI
ncbi:MAG: hypothetical protein IPN86_01230 [Saprospiraceae bacterium]|nr:hypothetical protein [Saprospiraceae bacterium]